MSNRYALSETEYAAALAAFRAAIAKLGGQGPTANVCRCTQGNISQLVARNSLLPPRFVFKIESATGIPRHHLRPDVYPVPQDVEVSKAPEAVAFDRNPKSQRAIRRDAAAAQ